MIDREEAKRAMLKQQEIDLRDPALQGINFDGDLAVEILDRLPEKRGEWIEEECETGLGWKRCSECKKLIPHKFKYNYCPHCGVRMEG